MYFFLALHITLSANKNCTKFLIVKIIKQVYLLVNYTATMENAYTRSYWNTIYITLSIINERGNPVHSYFSSSNPT